MEETAGEFGAKMKRDAQGSGCPRRSWTPSGTNTTVATTDLPTTVTGLKEQYDGDILVPGSATLVESLREYDLVDEYRLMVPR
jgi:dihydrofolate reductase